MEENDSMYSLHKVAEWGSISGVFIILIFILIELENHIHVSLRMGETIW